MAPDGGSILEGPHGPQGLVLRGPGASRGCLSGPVVPSFDMESNERGSCCNSPSSGNTAHHDRHSQGSRRARVLGHSLQSSAVTEQNSIHVQDSNKQVKGGHRLHRGFCICEVV